jgi:hypothetical protein
MCDKLGGKVDEKGQLSSVCEYFEETFPPSLATDGRSRSGKFDVYEKTDDYIALPS